MTCRNGTHYKCNRCAWRGDCPEYNDFGADYGKINLLPIVRPWLETPEETEATNRFYGIEEV